jgi:hypothetical protein
MPVRHRVHCDPAPKADKWIGILSPHPLVSRLLCRFLKRNCRAVKPISDARPTSLGSVPCGNESFTIISDTTLLDSAAHQCFDSMRAYKALSSRHQVRGHRSLSNQNAAQHGIESRVLQVMPGSGHWPAQAPLLTLDSWPVRYLLLPFTATQADRI